MFIVREIIKFIIFVLIQLFVFEKLIFFGFAMSFIYVSYLILLPLNVARGYLMLIAFLLGLIIDMIYNTGGVHAFSSVFVAYFRPTILYKAVGERHISGKKALVEVSDIKWNNMVVYSGLMILIHHTLVLFVEASSFHLFFYTLLKVVSSTLLSYILFLSFHYLLKKSK